MATSRTFIFVCFGLVFYKTSIARKANDHMVLWSLERLQRRALSLNLIIMLSVLYKVTSSMILVETPSPKKLVERRGRLEIPVQI